MNDPLTPMNESLSSQMMTRFSYKSVWEHVRCLLTYRKSLFLASVTVFGVVWGTAQAAIYFMGIDLRGWQFLAAAISVSLLAAVGWTLHLYLNDCPEGFEKESATAKRIAQIRRPLWEYRLARQLLEDRLRILDDALTDLIEGHVFVPIDKPLRLLDYADWTQGRLDSVRRMAEVALRLLIADFPAAMQSQEGREAQPVAILLVVNQIRSLYAETLDFERGNHAVAPPKALESLHRLQLGWTTPIRDGVQQVFRFLDQVLALDPRSHHRISFSITFGSPPNVEPFCRELDRLSGALPQIMDDELTS